LAGTRIDEELVRQQLGERRHEKVRDLNGGHRRRVEIARALLHRPRLLLLDEASVGLDPASRLALNRHVRQLCRDDGLAVLWTTHLLDEVQASDELLILNRGRLVAQGLASQIGADDASLAATFERLTADEART
jgi:ABC-2 type transport system ATP-binding protein